MDLDLVGKVSVVSGSTKGMGKAIAYGLLQEGAIVYLTGRDEKLLNSVYEGYAAQFRNRVYKFNGDLTNTETIKRLIGAIQDEHERLDVVVANIGSGQSEFGWDIEDDIWTKSFEINFFSAVRLSREAISVMLKQKSGSIIFISSIAGCETIPAPIQYSAAKSALLSYFKNTANLVASSGIRLNAVSPGNIYVKGGTWDIKTKENREGVEKYIKDSVPLQRLGKPEEIADAVCFLASERASFITGANLVVDGGQLKKVL